AVVFSAPTSNNVCPALTTSPGLILTLTISPSETPSLSWGSRISVAMGMPRRKCLAEEGTFSWDRIPILSNCNQTGSESYPTTTHILGVMPRAVRFDTSNHREGEAPAEPAPCVNL